MRPFNLPCKITLHRRASPLGFHSSISSYNKGVLWLPNLGPSIPCTCIACLNMISTSWIGYTRHEVDVPGSQCGGVLQPNNDCALFKEPISWTGLGTQSCPGNFVRPVPEWARGRASVKHCCFCYWELKLQQHYKSCPS